VDRAGTLVVSLDFELHWGVRDSLGVDEYGANLHGAREVIPRLLERFAVAGVGATWATVGMLFCESRDDLAARKPARLPLYDDPRLSPYGDVEKLGASEEDDPLHFAPSLIRQIAATPRQEVATHTFSHYYCLERGQTAADFEADLVAAVDVAGAAGVELRSIVFPRNQANPAYLPICAQHGLIAYRGNQAGRLHRPQPEHSTSKGQRALRLVDAYVPVSRPSARASAPSRAGGLVDVPASRFLRPRPRSRALASLERLKLRRVFRELERAARTGGVYHLWWHPHNFGVDQEGHLAQLDAVLARFSHLRAERGMRSLTMAQLAEEQLA
jgi:hypothetical protein